MGAQSTSCLNRTGAVTLGLWLGEAAKIAVDLVAIRRAIHAEPELSFQEQNTAAKVASELQRLGLNARKVTETGLMVDIPGGRPGPVVAIRADMDALPIQEESGADYASRRPGVMHACGHDGHTAILLGVARLLAARQAEMAGTVRLLFQPAEESPPGGARAMVAAGVLDGVSAVIGLHQDVVLQAGQVGVRSGPFLAASDDFTLRLTGKGGGGSAPQRGVDGIMLAAQAVVGLQVAIGRRLDPLTPALISMGTIRGGVKENVLADRVELTGIARTQHPQVRERLPALIRSVLEAVAAGQEARWDVEFRSGYPPVVNDQAISDLVRAAAAAELGPDAVKEAPSLMAADDMAYFMERVPGCYFLLGVGNSARGITAPAHTPKFDLDESALPVGVAVLAGAAWRLLNRG